jgi:hypothetical protein
VRYFTSAFTILMGITLLGRGVPLVKLFSTAHAAKLNPKKQKVAQGTPSDPLPAMKSLLALQTGWSPKAVEQALQNTLGAPSSREPQVWRYDGKERVILEFFHDELTGVSVEFNSPIEAKRLLPLETQGVLRPAREARDVISAKMIFEVPERGLRLELLRNHTTAFWIARPSYSSSSSSSSSPSPVPSTDQRISLAEALRRSAQPQPPQLLVPIQPGAAR